jgi:hypothetical protein
MMLPLPFPSRRLLAASAALLLTAATPVLAQTERFQATLNNTSGIGRSGVLGPVDIIIERYSTDEERARFLAALTERGPDGLLEAFQKAKSIGKLGAPGSIGYDIRYAVQFPGEDGGRRVVIATDRVMSFMEAANQPRTVDYPFTVVQLQLDGQGKGEGRASIYTKVDVDKRNNAIVLENFGIQPVMLMNVRASKDK